MLFVYTRTVLYQCNLEFQDFNNRKGEGKKGILSSPIFAISEIKGD